MIPRWMNVMRALSSSGFGRINYYEEVRRRLDIDRQFRRFFEQETSEVPQFYVDRIRKELGLLWGGFRRGRCITTLALILDQKQNSHLTRMVTRLELAQAPCLKVLPCTLLASPPAVSLQGKNSETYGLLRKYLIRIYGVGIAASISEFGVHLTHILNASAE